MMFYDHFTDVASIVANSSYRFVISNIVPIIFIYIQLPLSYENYGLIKYRMGRREKVINVFHRSGLTFLVEIHLMMKVALWCICMHCFIFSANVKIYNNYGVDW